jgi:hypothetical protein
MQSNRDYSALVEAVLNGEENPIMAYAELKQIADWFADAASQVKPAAVSEAEKYGKSFELHGIKFELRQGRRIYDFKHLQSWADATASVKAIEEKAKVAADNWAKFKTDMVDENGEVIEAASVKYTDPTLVVISKR